MSKSLRMPGCVRVFITYDMGVGLPGRCRSLELTKGAARKLRKKALRVDLGVLWDTYTMPGETYGQKV